MREEKMKSHAKNCLIVFLAMILVILGSGASASSILTVSADGLSQEVTVDFKDGPEVHLYPETFDLDVYSGQSSVLNFTISGAEVDAADWIFQEQEEAFSFDTRYLHVEVKDETHLDFTFRLADGHSTPANISIGILGKDENYYYIRLSLPGVIHKVAYDKNCEDEVTGIPEPFTVTYNGGYRFMRPEEDPVRNGYTFVGWSKAPNLYYGIFDNVGYAWAAEEETIVYAIWEKEKKEHSHSSDSDSSFSAESSNADLVITCQMAGYPENYAWNESLKACQPGFLDESGNFHALKPGVPDTADR